MQCGCVMASRSRQKAVHGSSKAACGRLAVRWEGVAGRRTALGRWRREGGGGHHAWRGTGAAGAGAAGGFAGGVPHPRPGRPRPPLPAVPPVRNRCRSRRHRLLLSGGLALVLLVSHPMWPSEVCRRLSLLCTDSHHSAHGSGFVWPCHFITSCRIFMPTRYTTKHRLRLHTGAPEI